MPWPIEMAGWIRIRCLHPLHCNLLNAAKTMTSTKNMTHMTQNKKRKFTRNIQCRYMANCWLGLMPIVMPPERPDERPNKPHDRKRRIPDRELDLEASRRYCFFALSFPSSSSLRPKTPSSFRQHILRQMKRTLVRSRSKKGIAPISDVRRTWQIIARE